MPSTTLGLRYRVRQAGWAAAFFAILAALLFLVLLLSHSARHEITIYEQAGLVLVATIGVQLLRREPLRTVTGSFDLNFLHDFLKGTIAGAVLMLAPALFLWRVGCVHFELVGTPLPQLVQATMLMLGVALTEELLFRGLLFQRLLEAVGTWPAQLAIASLFTLTHLGNPGMVGETKLWACANIFLASILFGLAYLRTRRLAMPLGIHFAANVTQGIILGFGVSGTNAPRMLIPISESTPPWLTGGDFGLEASPFGFAALVVIILLVARMTTGGLTDEYPASA